MKKIETEIMIAAPNTDVWHVLTDFATYMEWNPFIVKASGTAIEGTQLQLTMRPGGKKKDMNFCPTIQIVDFGRHLQWLGRFLVPKLFDGRHEFILESVAGNTRLRHNETFTGIVPTLFPSSLDFVESKFQELNHALKSRVESNKDNPTS